MGRSRAPNRPGVARLPPQSGLHQDQITYELYYSGQLATSTLAAQLDARLAALESVVGRVRAEEVRCALEKRVCTMGRSV